MLLRATVYIINRDGRPRDRTVRGAITAVEQFAGHVEQEMRANGELRADERLECGPIGEPWKRVTV